MSLPTDPLFASQWHIDHRALEGATVDLNLLPIWGEYTGAGVKVGVVDDAIEWTHADLDDNYDPFLQMAEDGDALPVSDLEAHGTAVAGIIAAEQNGLGSVGIAYEATLTGVQVFGENGIFEGQSKAVLAMAAQDRFDVVNHSWGYTHPFAISSLDPANADFYAGIANAADAGRGGLGTVMVVAAGNHRQYNQTTNLSGFTSDRHMIVVGAVDESGLVTRYSNRGASLLVMGVSDWNLGSGGIVTTDRVGQPGWSTGDWSDGFGGTSAATPMISGIVALMLDANPNLGWRDVHEILALSARHVGTPIGGPRESHWNGRFNTEDYSWTTNAANTVNGGGFHFSNDYGFGLVDAHAAVRLAESWTGQDTSANETSLTASFTGPAVVPDNNPAGVEVAIPVAGAVDVERVQLKADISHGRAQDLIITLISPSGTESRIYSMGGLANQQFVDFEFGSNAFRGEDATGIWTVRIVDKEVGGVGTVHGLDLEIHGEAAGENDTFFFTDEYAAVAALGARDVLRDEGGIDALNAAAVSSDALIDLRPGRAMSIDGTSLSIAAGSWIEHALGGDGADRLTGNGLANLLGGGRGTDTLQGAAGNDTLDGSHGDDVASGSAGNDRLLGDLGNDRLLGGEGRDRLVGGLGDDTLSGGASRDVFVFDRHSFGRDVVAAFDDGLDVLVFRGAVADDFSDFTLVGNGTNLVRLQIQGDGMVVLRGVAGIDIDPGDFQFLA